MLLLSKLAMQHTTPALDSLSLEGTIDPHPLIVAPETPLLAAISLMNLPNIDFVPEQVTQPRSGCALVVADSQLLGLLTEGDVMRLVASGTLLEGLTVASVMTSQVISLKASECNASTALNLLRRYRIKQLPIVDEQNRLVGVVSLYKILDLLQGKVAQLEAEKAELSGSLSAERERLLAQVALRIRQSLNLQDILNATVTEVRQLLGCDRVLVYQFAADMSGTIVAESVGWGWTATIGCNIRDTYFQTQGAAEYAQGRQQAIANIYEAGLTDCHLKLLEQFQIKANLVVPIVLEVGDNYSTPHLWGLLSAHQCSAARQWQPALLELLDKLAVQIAIAIQQASAFERAQAELAERQRAEAKLQESEQFLGSIYNGIANPIFVVDVSLEGEFRFAGLNPTQEQLMGRRLEDVRGKSPKQVLPAVDAAAVSANYARCVRLGKTISYEEWGMNSWWLTTLTPLRDSNSRIYRLIGTSINITERKQAEEALRKSEATNRVLIEAIPDLMIRMARDGTYLDFIPAKDFKTVMISSDMRGRNIFEAMPAEIAHQRLNYVEQALSTSKTQVYEYQLLLDSEIRHEEARIVKSGSDEVLVIVRDISDRKQAEAALRESEERFRSLSMSSPIGIYMTNAEGCCTWTNPRLQAIAGFTFEEALGEGWQQFVHPDDIEHLVSECQECRYGLRPKLNEYRFQNKDGTIHWVRGTSSPMFADTGELIGYVGALEDITERKQVEEALQSLVAGTAAVTGSSFFPVLAQHLVSALGVSCALVSERVGEQLRTLAFWADGQLQPNFTYEPEQHPCAMALREGIYYCASQVQTTFPQNQFLVEIQAESYLGVALLATSGEVIGTLCIFDSQPLLERDRAQNILRVFAARAMAEMERQRATEALSRLNRELEARVEERTAELRHSNEQLHAQIAERQRVEAALRESEERFRRIFDDAPIGIVLTRCSDSKFQMVNRAFCELLGYAQPELSANSCLAISHPEDLPQEQPYIKQICTGEINTYQLEKRYIKKNREIVWGHLTATAIRNQSNEMLYILGMVEDITERKQAEDALWQQIQRERLMGAIAQRMRESLDLKAILNTTVASVQKLLLADRVLVYRVWPDGSGSAIAEAVAAGWTKILDITFPVEVFPEESYQRYVRGRTYALADREQGGVLPCLVEFLQQIGVRAKVVVPIIQQETLWGLLIAHQCEQPRQWQSWEIALLEQLATQLAIAIQQSEIYEQLQIELQRSKKAEETIKASLNEKELLLKEVHHRVKNNLQVISSLFSLQSQYIEDPQILSILSDSQNRIGSMALIHEKLYHSSNLAKIDFADYIQNLVSNLFASYNISPNLIRLKLHISNISLNLDRAIPCGLLINELVTNSLKHAFPKQQAGEISIDFSVNPKGKVCLIVKDTGVGLPEGLDLQMINSLGLRLVRALTRQLKGKLEVFNSNGTVFQIIFPQASAGKRF